MVNHFEVHVHFQDVEHQFQENILIIIALFKILTELI